MMNHYLHMTTQECCLPTGIITGENYIIITIHMYMYNVIHVHVLHCTCTCTV